MWHAKIYKNKHGQWTVDIRGDRVLLSIMANKTVHLADGTTVGRWHRTSWTEALYFVFGPPSDAEENTTPFASTTSPNQMND